VDGGIAENQEMPIAYEETIVRVLGAEVLKSFV
jgi:hypothetical protein